jgi:hypothetical protein
LGKNQARKKKWLRKKNMTEIRVHARNRQVNETKKDLRKNQWGKNDWDAECMHEIAKSIKQNRLEKKPAEKKKMSEMPNVHAKSPSQ